MYFNVNFNVFFKLIKVHLLVSKPYIYHKIHGATIKIEKAFVDPLLLLLLSFLVMVVVVVRDVCSFMVSLQVVLLVFIGL